MELSSALEHAADGQLEVLLGRPASAPAVDAQLRLRASQNTPVA